MRRTDLRMSTALLVVLAAVVPCTCLFFAPAGQAEADLAPDNEYAGKCPSGTRLAMHLLPFKI